MQDRNTHSPNTTAAIYCRISSDKTGKSAGVERQRGDCLLMADRLGLKVVATLTDNDISAYSGKPRPSYQQLLELMKSGEIGSVLAYHQDRLQRSLVELEEYVDASDAGRVTTHTVLAGQIDLSTPSGRFQARIVGSAARYEVEHMMERQRDAKLDAARQGKFMGGQRPFGFEPRREGIRQAEAAILRDLARKVIDGYSFRTLAIELNQQGITTQHGKEWNALKVRNVLIRPINAGIVLHQGIEYEADTPAIFTRETWDAMNAVIKDSRQRSVHPGKFRKQVLSGMVFCGGCGARMYHKAKQQRDGSCKPQVSCTTKDANTGMPGHGCGKTSRMVAPIIDLVFEAVIYRLSSPDVAEELERQRSGDNPIRQLTTALHELETRRSEIKNDYYVARILDREEYEQLMTSTKEEIERAEQQLKQATAASIVGGLDVGQGIRSTLETASIERQRDILSHVIEKVIVHPRGQVSGYKVPQYKKWKFDPKLVEISWKA